MNRLKLTLLLAIASFATLTAQQTTIPLYPNQSKTQPEVSDTTGGRIANLSIHRIRRVENPSITLYKAEHPTADNKTVIVCPGGGYYLLSYDLEGSEVCQWLNKQGVNAVLLKYRVPRPKNADKHTLALADAQRAMSIVRSRAAEFQLDPNNIGVMGFSAGAHLSVMSSVAHAQRSYTPIDHCDSVSLLPNFNILVYPAYLDNPDQPFALAPEVIPTRNTPPTFIVQAEDDDKYVDSSLFYYYALKELGIPATLHLYPNGGHGFGARTTGHTSDRWLDDLAIWLQQL